MHKRKITTKDFEPLDIVGLAIIALLGLLVVLGVDGQLKISLYAIVLYFVKRFAWKMKE